MFTINTKDNTIVQYWLYFDLILRLKLEVIVLFVATTIY